jgi:hypothetical protein
VQQLPYKAWTISPTSSCTALLTLHTPVLDILLDIGEGWCKLLQPVIRELKGIQAQQLPPRVLLQVCGSSMWWSCSSCSKNLVKDPLWSDCFLHLHDIWWGIHALKMDQDYLILQHLSQCGLSLLPEDDDAPFVAATIKVRLCCCITLLITTFTVLDLQPSHLCTCQVSGMLVAISPLPSVGNSWQWNCCVPVVHLDLLRYQRLKKTTLVYKMEHMICICKSMVCNLWISLISGNVRSMLGYEGNGIWEICMSRSGLDSACLQTSQQWFQ